MSSTATTSAPDLQNYFNGRVAAVFRHGICGCGESRDGRNFGAHAAFDRG